MPEYLCRICGSKIRKTKHTAREMMFGTRETFVYDECFACSSLQIEEIPDSETLSRHYPQDYYSFSTATPGSRSERLRHWIATQRDKASFGQRNLLGSFLRMLKPTPLGFQILVSAGLEPRKRILDVGCGSGSVLNGLASLGFRNLLGIDPFISSDAITRQGVSLQKGTLNSVHDSFDVIMFHHSLEHVPDPYDELSSANQKLRPGGRCIVRIPTPTSLAWEIYGTDWVQFDAPRHLTLISRNGMNILAQRSGFVLEQVIDDSVGLHLAASELYRHDIPFREQDVKARFSFYQLTEFESRASAANALHLGDQAAFILAKYG